MLVWPKGHVLIWACTRESEDTLGFVLAFCLIAGVCLFTAAHTGGSGGFCPDLPSHRGNTGTSDARDFVSFSWDLGNLNSGLHAYTASLWPPSCLPKMLPFTGFDYYLALVIVLSRIGDWAWHFRAVRDCHPFPEPLDFLLGEGDKAAEFASVQLFGVISMPPGKERRAGRLPFQ